MGGSSNASRHFVENNPPKTRDGKSSLRLLQLASDGWRMKTQLQTIFGGNDHSSSNPFPYLRGSR
jgi:hypothetical protein